MQFLLDTNVLSEVARPQPDPAVVEWMRARSTMELAISVLTLGEIEKGVALLPAGRRRRALQKWVDEDLRRQFTGRILPVDAEVAQAWGRLTAAGRRKGRQLPVIDGLLLATADVHDLTLVTRNEADCAGRGVDVLNPWSEGG